MKKYILVIISLLFTPFVVNAASATIDLNTSNTNIKVGDAVNLTVNVSSSSNISYYEYTLDYDESKLKLVTGNAYTVDRANNSSTKRFTNSYKFRALTSGTSKITAKSYAVLDTNDKSMNVSVDPVTIRINNSNSQNSTSGSTYLSALEIEGYSLTPNFSPSVTNYTLNINENVSQITINAESEDPNATIKGNGVIALNSDTEQIELTVSNDGDERVYTINVNMDDDNVITTTINEESYVIVKDSSKLDIPDGFVEKEIIVDGQEVIALYNDKLDITLVGLQDSNNNIEFYIYNENTNSYSPYIVLTFDSLSFYPLGLEEELANYSKYTITINNTDIDCYKLSSDSDFSLIYGVNTKTGEKSWYSYDEVENTLQRYNFDLDDFYNNKIKNTQILIYILSGTTFLFGIGVIVLVIKKNNKKIQDKKKDNV